LRNQSTAVGRGADKRIILAPVARVQDIEPILGPIRRAAEINLLNILRRRDAIAA